MQMPKTKPSWHAAFGYHSQKLWRYFLFTVWIVHCGCAPERKPIGLFPFTHLTVSSSHLESSPCGSFASLAAGGHVSDSVQCHHESHRHKNTTDSCPLSPHFFTLQFTSIISFMSVKCNLLGRAMDVMGNYCRQPKTKEKNDMHTKRQKNPWEINFILISKSQGVYAN